MSYDQSLFQATLDHVSEELAGIRTGRANPALIENVTAMAYGSPMPIVQLASITVQDNRTLVVQPWDKNVLKDIERALQQADLGMTPVNDGTVLRLAAPSLTEERRKEFIKLLHQKLEAGRVAVRKIREDLQKDLKQSKQDGAIGEDEFSRQQKDLQKTVDEAVAHIDQLGKKKEVELLTV